MALATKSDLIALERGPKHQAAQPESATA
jgi:hypothetical protein